MDGTIKNFDVDSLDLHCLLPVKAKLHQEGLLDSNLKTNLEFSIQAMESLCTSGRRNACLMVEGDIFLLRLNAGKPDLYYTVHTGTNGPQLHRRVELQSPLTDACLSESHFAGHLCRDDIDGCLRQATNVLKQNAESFLDHLELKITCGELHLTYRTPQPLHVLHIKPHYRVFLRHTLSVERILETKADLEKSGEMGKSLLACFHHLLQIFGDFCEFDSRIILQGDGEMVEFIIGNPSSYNIPYYIYTDAQNNVQIKQTYSKYLKGMGVMS